MIQIKLCFLPLMILSFTTVSSADVNAKKNPLLTINAGDGGIFSNGSNIKTVTIRNGITWGEYKNNMPMPTKSGYDIEKWTFTSDPKAAMITDDFTFTADTTIYAIWGAGVTEHFATDSWATIIDNANRGLDYLKNAYQDDIATYGNTFVINDINNENEVKAKTRKLELPGIGTYNVRVVGEGADKIDGKNKVATLTFEFEELISPSVSYDNITRQENVWKDSDLRTFLNNSFYFRLPSVIRDNLKSVVKTTGDGKSATTTSTTVDKVFVPSLYELGLYTVEETTTTTTQFENNIYQFYQNNNNANARIKYYTNPNTSNKEALSYWTRSPFLDSTNKAHIIDSEGDASKSYTSVIMGNAIAPCFAIGDTNAYSVAVTKQDHVSDVRYNAYASNDTNLVINVKLEDGYRLPYFDPNAGEVNDNLEVYVSGTRIYNESRAYKFTTDTEKNIIEIVGGNITGNVEVKVKGVLKSE